MDEIGTVTIEGHYDRATGHHAVRITDADRRIRIGSELLDAVKAAGDYSDEYGRIRFDGDRVIFSDDYGQRFIYQIHWDDYTDGGYLAEWPD